jgi:hypothetical protein
VLGHVGLGGVDLRKQFPHILFTMTESADDAKSHRCGHDAKNLGGLLEDLFGFGPRFIYL